MKISIGTKIKQGPWGGGNLFAINLANFLKDNNHQVVFDLKDDDIDLILITEPRKTSESSAYTPQDVSNYQKYIKEDSVVVHRVNECDERKNTDYVNKYLIYSNKFADYTIFVSTWIKELYQSQGLDVKNSSVVMAGADESIFNRDNFQTWDDSKKIKVVTHHWGANWNKGFDIYSRLDELLSTPKYADKIDFTYIGNLPDKFYFKNANHINPLSGNELANELKKNHIYLTASLNEPSGNHHIEASQCGIPVLYINSGGIPEYCQDFGEEFESCNFEDKLNKIIDNYEIYRKKMVEYPYGSTKMCKEYLALFEELINTKNMYIKKRPPLKKNFLGKLIYKLSIKIKP
jgi:glycosyltransferase involved in cell wall biosynthesis